MARFALTACVAVSLFTVLVSAPAFALDVKSGLWEISLEGSEVVHKACMTREILDADISDLKLPTGVECTNDTREKTSKLLVTHTSCTGNFTIEGDTRVEVLSPGEMSMQSTSVMKIGDQQRQVSTSAHYKWLSDDCGEVKPIDLQRSKQ